MNKVTLFKINNTTIDRTAKQFNEIVDPFIISYMNRFGENVTLDKLQNLPKVKTDNIESTININVLDDNNKVLIEYWYPYIDYIKMCR